MMSRTQLECGSRIKGTWAGLLSLAMISLSFGCVFNEPSENEGPESTYGWSWQAGSNSAGEAGTYGTKGTASSSNMPGARGYHLIWLDSGGKLWVFGGHGHDSADVSGHLNDLWSYNPSTKEWAWISGSKTIDERGTYGMKGIAASGNVPGGRDSCASWIDSNGRFWVFGGFGLDSNAYGGDLNDVWMFDPSSQLWTWIAGSTVAGEAGIYGTKGIPSSTNIPGARVRMLYWKDSDGKFWLFGGKGKDSAGAVGGLNDLWKFDPMTLEWTWIAGSAARDQAGVYGTKGAAAPTNLPGARDASTSWRDANGRIWLFGGEGYDWMGNTGQLSDLWMLDPATLQWTWISGNNTTNQVGVYGTQGTASASNIPGGNHGANSWLDPNGKLWLFGGTGYDSAGTLGVLNSLWKFDPTTLEWTWVSGEKTANLRGHYGTLGKMYLSNTPGARDHAVSWVNSSGEMWLFGGDGYDVRGTKDFLNDLWKYTR